MFLDRLTAFIGFAVIGVTATAYLLGLFGFLLLGPVLILGAVAAYTLWTLWWGVTAEDDTARDTSEADVSLRRTWPILAAIAVVVALVVPASEGFGLSLGSTDAHLLSGIIAGDIGELTVDEEWIGPGTSPLARGWRSDGGQAAYDGGRVGVASVAAASWFGTPWAHRIGLVFFVVAGLSWASVAVRRSGAWPAALAVVAIGVTPGAMYGMSAASPGTVALGIVGLAVWALNGVATRPTVARAAIGGSLIALVMGVVPAAGWSVLGGATAWTMAWRSGPSGWIERNRRRRMMGAMAMGALPVLVLVLVDAWLTGRLGDVFDGALVAAAASVVLAAAGVGWKRLRIARPAGPLPLLVVALAVPVSIGLVTFTSLQGPAGFGGPSVDAWIGIGPALIVVGLLGWVWFSDIRRDTLVDLVVGTGLVAATVALVGPITLLPSGFGPFLPIVIPTLAIGAAWIISELFRDPERPIFQTSAVVFAVALVAVPLLLGRARIFESPQPGGVAAIDEVCDVLAREPAVVVVGEEPALASGVAAGVAAHCAVPAARGDLDGDVDVWRTAAVEEGRTLQVVFLNGLAPMSLTVRDGPTLDFQVVVPTIGEVPVDYRRVVATTALSSR